MKKIFVETTITQIINRGNILPKSPMFTIYNDGERTVVLNNNFFIRPGGSFSVNVENVVAAFADREVEVVNNTQYFISFVEDTTNTQRASAQLVEVFIKKAQ